MKSNLVFLFAAFTLVSTCYTAIAQQTEKVTPAGVGYLQYLPTGYQSGSDNYPVVISLHGIKEKGTSSTDPKLVMKDLHRVANVGLPKYVRLGEKYPFILISPQLKDHYGTWPPSYIRDVIDHVKRTLRVDNRRIYLTGLSLGGYGVWKTAGEYPEIFAAIAPICAGGNAVDKAHAIAKENVAVWGFHGSRDYIVSHSVTTNMVNAINAAPRKPDPLAKVTIFPGMGHIIWDKAYHETNVLQWLLSFRKGSATASGNTNSRPVVNAGEDIFLTLPANTATLEGQATDQDGVITGYSWTKISGPDALFSETTNPSLKVANLVEGVYVFRLTAKDNQGASASDEVNVTVKTERNIPPVVNAGTDRTITLPVNSVELRAAVKDEDGSITSYHWTESSGSSTITMHGETTPILSVSGLVAGNYTFKLTVRDNDGAVAQDVIIVKVLEMIPDTPPSAPSSTPSATIAPADFDGADKSSELPQGIIQPVGLPWLRQ